MYGHGVQCLRDMNGLHVLVSFATILFYNIGFAYCEESEYCGTALARALSYLRPQLGLPFIGRKVSIYSYPSRNTGWRERQTYQLGPQLNSAVLF